MSKRKRQNQKRNQAAAAANTLGTALHPAAAGIDVGAEELVAAVPPGRGEAPHVRTFSAFTEGVHALRDWLLGCHIKTVAMESTGNYWLCACLVLEEAGIDISRHRPMTFEELEDWEGLNFDLIVTLAPEGCVGVEAVFVCPLNPSVGIGRATSKRAQRRVDPAVSLRCPIHGPYQRTAGQLQLCPRPNGQGAGGVRGSVPSWVSTRIRARTTRKPRLLFWLPGVFLLRLADRQFCPLLFQLPPRLTRLSPDCERTKIQSSQHIPAKASAANLICKRPKRQCLSLGLALSDPTLFPSRVNGAQLTCVTPPTPAVERREAREDPAPQEIHSVHRTVKIGKAFCLEPQFLH